MIGMVVAGPVDVDWTELTEGCAEGDGLTRVVVTCQHLEANMERSEISVLEASEVTGISSAGLEDPTVKVTGADLNSMIPL